MMSKEVTHKRTRRPSKRDELENIRVVVRVRPLNRREEAEKVRSIVHIDSTEKVITLHKPSLKKEIPKSFKFDHVFSEKTEQIEIYKNIAVPIVEKTLKGYNGTIFAYGQTGTGKTFTMSGDQTKTKLKGIIPNTFSHIFTKVLKASEERSFVVTVTYLEIYNEHVRDLLSRTPNTKLQVRERADLGVYVKNLKGFTVDSIESVTELMNRGNANRITRTTSMNDASSRSHAVFTLTIEAKDSASNKTTTGKLNLVDLAGSERLSRTGATGENLREASNINQSLSALGNVIATLAEGKGTHVPYRNSKLTRLLQDSLGGNSRTVLIAMLSPAEIDFEESVCTLRYASRAKYIRNTLKVNIETKKGLIETFEQEIAELQRKLSDISIHEEKVLKPKKKGKHKATQLGAVSKELLEIEKQKEDLLQKIALIQKKILVGGENLFEKAQQQQFMLEVSDAEIRALKENQRQLRSTLKKKEAERVDVEEKFSNLQEADAGVTKKIRKLQWLLNETKDEHAYYEHEHQREMQALRDSNQLLTRQSKLTNAMTDNYIPKEYRRKLAINTFWNDDTNEYQIRGVAYAGNNLRKRPAAKGSKNKTSIEAPMPDVYVKYDRTKKKSKSKSPPSKPGPSGLFSRCNI